MLSKSELRRINQLALIHLQTVCDHLWGYNYAPADLALQLDPTGERAMGQFRVNEDGAWMDVGHEGRAREYVQTYGRDVISLVAYCGRCDYDEAAVALRDFVDRLDPPARPTLKPDFGKGETTRPEPTVKPIRDPRSLRRVGS